MQNNTQTLKDKNPWLSVIIPAHNVEKYITDCLNSLLTNDLSNIEIIISDDNSTDSTLEKLSSFQAQLPKIVRVISFPKNLGISEARNILVKEAIGEYLWFIDADDKITPYAIDFAKKKINEYHPSVLSFDYAELRQEKNSGEYFCGDQRSTFDGPTEQLLTDKSLIAKHLFRIGKFYAWVRIIHHSCWETPVRFPAGHYYEDVAVIPAILLNGSSFVHISQTLIYYRQRPGSIQSTPTAQKFKDIAAAAALMGQSLHGLPLDADARFECAYFSARIYREACRKTVRSGTTLTSEQHKVFLDYYEKAANMRATALLHCFLLRGEWLKFINYSRWFFFPSWLTFFDKFKT